MSALAFDAPDNASTPADTVMGQAGSDRFPDALPVDEGPGSGQFALPDAVRLALFNDPQVAEARARVCQATHRLGLERARARPQVSASVTGSRQIVGRVKRYDQNNPEHYTPPKYTLDPETRRVRETPGKITPAGREINESGAHQREFKHREKNNIYDGTVSVRVNLIDWGQSRAAIDGGEINRHVARIEADAQLEQRSMDLLELAMQLRLMQQVQVIHSATATRVDQQVQSVKARVEAGTGRIADLREAQLLALDIEIEINRITAQRDILAARLANEFDLTLDDADALFDAYLGNRPAALAYILAEDTQKAHALRLRRTAVTHEETQIKGSRYPRFDGVVDGTIFDMTDYEDEYEVVGKLEMKLPLYDGGAAAARLRETAWRSRELQSSLEAMTRAHSSEMESVTSRFNDLEREEAEARQRLSELEERNNSLRALQGKTVVSPQQLAQIERDLGQAEVSLIEIKFQRERMRATALHLAERLDEVLALNSGEPRC